MHLVDMVSEAFARGEFKEPFEASTRRATPDTPSVWGGTVWASGAFHIPPSESELPNTRTDYDIEEVVRAIIDGDENVLSTYLGHTSVSARAGVLFTHIPADEPSYAAFTWLTYAPVASRDIPREAGLEAFAPECAGDDSDMIVLLSLMHGLKSQHRRLSDAGIIRCLPLPEAGTYHLQCIRQTRPIHTPEPLNEALLQLSFATPDVPPELPSRFYDVRVGTLDYPKSTLVWDAF